jgi:lipocalin-like protein
MVHESVVGTWELVRFQGRNAKGETKSAFRGSAQGLLVYTAEGYMSAVLSEVDRPSFRSSDYRGGTPDEALMAVKTYISYCGRYTIAGDTIKHHVELSLYPNWVGHDQVRNLRFENGMLILSTPSFLLSRDAWTFELAWKRV